MISMFSQRELGPKGETEIDDSGAVPMRHGILIIALFFGLLGGWAALAPLNGAVIAQAEVKVDGNRKSIQHFEGGIVREIRIKDGDIVAKGSSNGSVSRLFTDIKADVDLSSMPCLLDGLHYKLKSLVLIFNLRGAETTFVSNVSSRLAILLLDKLG